MKTTHYSLEVQWDFRQMLVGFYWSTQLLAVYIGPLSLRFNKVPSFEEIFGDGFTLINGGDHEFEHDFQPVEGELGKYECANCGEIRYDPAVN